MANDPKRAGRDPSTGESIPAHKTGGGETIPVKKTSGGSWWPWLLGLLALAALIFLLLSFLGEGEEVDVAVEDEIERVEPVTTPGISVVTTVAELQNDPLTHIGTDAELTGVEVTRVTGDSTFVIGEGEMEYLVVLNEEMDTSPPMTEGRYDVTEGQVIDVMGEVRAAEDLDMEAYGVTGQEAQELRDNGAYLWANRLDILERPN